MEFFQYQRNPWGQEILVRISWDLLWAAAIAGLLFIVVHLLFRWFWFPKHGAAAEGAAGEEGEAERRAAAVPERVPRHSLASRLFHWIMAAAIIVLLVTAFFPVLGIQFAWVTIHWIAGLVLIGSVVFHIIHATFWMELEAVRVGVADVRDMWRRFARSVRGSGPAPKKPGKYPLENKLYHHVISLTTVAVMVTGVLMMFRVQTPFWTRNPYLFSEQTWGWVYVLHGLSAVALVTLVMAHVYFAVLPEKRWITWSMIYGWIDRDRYLEHHDSQRWAILQDTTTTEQPELLNRS
ncbi:MAG: cytochrome b/b6 domain-containing protein [Acidobacteriota bacterium]